MKLKSFILTQSTTRVETSVTVKMGSKVNIARKTSMTVRTMDVKTMDNVLMVSEHSLVFVPLDSQEDCVKMKLMNVLQILVTLDQLVLI